MYVCMYVCSVGNNPYCNHGAGFVWRAVIEWEKLINMSEGRKKEEKVFIRSRRRTFTIVN